MKKENILDNVAQYDAAALVDYIKQGVVTFEELVQDTDGEFSAAKRKEVKRLLESGDEDTWRAARAARTIEAVQQYLDSYPDGRFRTEARELKAAIEEETARDSQAAEGLAAWNAIDRDSLEDLRNFVRNFPDNRFVVEANKRINKLILDLINDVDIEALVTQIKQFQTNRQLTSAQRDENVIATIQRFLDEGNISKSELLDKIREDHNLLSASVVRRLIEEGGISIESLLNVGIDKRFIKRLFDGQHAQSFGTPSRLEKINKQSTEVYFWGIPSSGKSCALGAILSSAASGTVARSMTPDTGSQGYGYMTKLINLFNPGEVGALMEGTAIDSFYEMGFDLYDNDRKVHPITCIDMAGELMRCMYKANAGDSMEEKDMIMLDTMTNVLIDNRSVNRKIHVFVIEYGAEDRLYEGLPQKAYLDGAVSYIRDTDIFKNDTDAIYIMISKADKVRNATTDIFDSYIEEKYKGFYNTLEQICKNYEINGGKVEKLAFSLGEVCFQNYCRFDPRPAQNFVRELLKRTGSARTGFWGKLGKTMKS